MRILHCRLANFYIDNYGYQENILPRMHKIQGHEVMILASTETYLDKVHLGYVEAKEYINEDGIPVHRIPYKGFYPHKVKTKLRIYKGVYEELERFKPDFIFLHDVQFLSIKEVAKYVKRYTPEMYATLLLPAGLTSRTSIAYKDEDKILGRVDAGDADDVYVNEILPAKMKYNLESLKK